MTRSTPRGVQRSLASVAALAAFALVLVGCSGETDSASEEEAVLTVAVPTPPVSLDPALQNADPTNKWFIEAAYEPLIRVLPDGEYAPAIAESWEYLDDTSTLFQLTIREGVTFSDGTEVTAEDVADSLTYFIESGINGASWLGAETIATAVDDRTVQIETVLPNPILPTQLTQRSYLGSVINSTGLADPELLKSGSYGAGPYVIDAAATVPNDLYVYVPNENYYEPERQHWDRIELKVAGSTAAALQAVESGVADLMRGDVSTAEAASDSLIVESQPLGMFGISFFDRAGEISPPMADVRVRQALAYAIDREAIADAVWGDYGDFGGTLAIESFGGYSEETREAFAYDPERAVELLEEAGYGDGFTFDIQTANLGGADIPAQAIVENWAAIGVTANLTVFSDTSQLVAETLDKKFAAGVYLVGGNRQYQLAQTFFTGGATQYNPFGSEDAELFDLFAEASAEADLELQDELYQQAQERVTVDLTWLTNVGYTPTIMIANDSVTGLDFNSVTASTDIAWGVRPAE